MALESLKIGDPFFVKGRECFMRLLVDRVGKAYITSGTSRYRITDGRKAGEDGWRVSYAMVPTPEPESEYCQMVARSRFRRAVGSGKWETMPAATLEAMTKCINDYAEAQEPAKATP